MLCIAHFELASPFVAQFRNDEAASFRQRVRNQQRDVADRILGLLGKRFERFQVLHLLSCSLAPPLAAVGARKARAEFLLVLFPTIPSGCLPPRRGGPAAAARAACPHMERREVLPCCVPRSGYRCRRSQRLSAPRCDPCMQSAATLRYQTRHNRPAVRRARKPDRKIPPRDSDKSLNRWRPTHA